MPSLAESSINLVSVIIFIPVNALILWVVLKLFKLKANKYLTALKVAAIAAIILFIAGEIVGLAFGPVLAPTAGLAALAGLGVLLLLISLAITVAVNTFLVKKFYNQETKKAVLIGVVWMAANWIVAMIVGVVIVAVVMAIAIGLGLSGGLA